MPSKSSYTESCVSEVDEEDSPEEAWFPAVNAFCNFAVPLGIVGSWLEKKLSVGSDTAAKMQMRRLLSYSAGLTSVAAFCSGVLFAAKFVPEVADLIDPTRLLASVDVFVLAAFAWLLMVVCRGLGSYLGQKAIISDLPPTLSKSVVEKYPKLPEKIEKVKSHVFSNALLMGFFGASAGYVRDTFGCHSAPTASKEPETPEAALRATGLEA